MERAITFAAIVLLLFIGLRSLVRVYMRVKNCTERTEAILTGYDESTVSDPDTHVDSPTYTPVFTFYAGGRNVTAAGWVGTGNMKYDVGERVMIRYNPQNPKEISVPGENRIGILVGIGAIVAAIAVLILPNLPNV